MYVGSPEQPSSHCCAHVEEIAWLASEVADLRQEVADLRAAFLAPRRQGDNRDFPPSSRGVATGNDVARADQSSSSRAKIALYRALFVGRGDMYAHRWENPRKGTSGWSPAHRGDWRTPRDEREYLPVTDAVVAAPLEGLETVGLYPLLTDDTCRLLVVDFDKSTWQLDARAYVEAARMAGVPTAVEVFRSGEGAHVWTFFTSPVVAAAARSLGRRVVA